MATRSCFSRWRNTSCFVSDDFASTHRALGWSLHPLSRTFLSALFLVAWSGTLLFAGNVYESRVNPRARITFIESLGATLQAAPRRCASGTCRAPHSQDSKSTNLFRGSRLQTWRAGGAAARSRSESDVPLPVTWPQSWGNRRGLFRKAFSHRSSTFGCRIRTAEEEAN